MRRFCFGTALVLLAAVSHAEDAADRPYLVLQNNGHTAPIWKILYTPDGKRILTVSADKTVRLWDAHSGERLGILRPPVGPGTQGELRAGALSPNGKTLAVGGVGYEMDGKHIAPIYLIDLAGEHITAALKDKRMDVVLCLAFSPDGKRLASGGGKGTAFLWDVGTGKCLYALEGPTDAAPPDEKYPPDIRDIAFSPNGKLLAAACRDKTAWIWSAETGRKAAGPLRHEDSVLCVAWKDDDALATAGAERAGIHLWDREGKALRSYDKPRPEPVTIESLAFLPGKNKEELFYVWTGPLDRKNEKCESGGAFLNLDNPEKSRAGYTWTHHASEVRGAVSPDGKAAATSGGGENRLDLWVVKDGKHLHYLRGKWMMAFHATGPRRAGSWPGPPPGKSPRTRRRRSPTKPSTWAD